MVTQVQIAEKTGLDVSSVNKILNEVKGPMFKRRTVQRVFKVAERLGYNFNRPTKYRAIRILQSMFKEHRCAGCSACSDTERFLKQIGVM